MKATHLLQIITRIVYKFIEFSGAAFKLELRNDVKYAQVPM